MNPQFHSLLYATRCGYVWVEGIQMFARFMFRRDGNYDVDLLPEREIPVHYAAVRAQERLLSQYRHLPLDTVTADRLFSALQLCGTEVHSSNERQQFVLTPVGEMVALPPERRN